MLTLGLTRNASEDVKDKVITLPVLARVETELLEAMVTLSSVGVVISIVKELTDRLSLVLLLLSSVTEILQLL
jgi:hypothetical protein